MLPAGRWIRARKNLQGLVPNPSPRFAPAGSQVPAVTGTPAIYRAPSVPCKHAGHDGTRRGDAASSEHRGREPRRRRGGSVHGRWREGHRGKVKQGCNKAVDFGVAPGREEVPVARPRPCVPLALPPRPRVTLEALPAALSRPALPTWAVPARIRLLAGESCYLPSNLFGGFSGDGTSAGWGCGGTEARWVGTGGQGWERGAVGHRGGPASLHGAGTPAGGCCQTFARGPR